MSTFYQNQSVKIELMSCIIMGDKIAVFNNNDILINQLLDFELDKEYTML